MKKVLRSGSVKMLAYLLPAVLMLLGAGCVSETEKPKNIGGILPKAEYVPQTGYQLELSLVSPVILPGGCETFVTYSLKNVGKKPIRIDDWFAVPDANIKIFCQAWTPDMPEPNPNLWIPVGADYPDRIVRYPMELNPGNLITIRRKLPFVEKLVVQPGTERRYFIRAELNLKTVKASSRLDVLHIRAQEGEGKEK